MREAGENPVTLDKELYPLLYAHERESRSESGPLAAEAAEKVEVWAQKGFSFRKCASQKTYSRKNRTLCSLRESNFPQKSLPKS